MEHFVLRIASAQQADGHRVFIIALQGGSLLQEAASLGLPCYVLGGARKALRAAKGACILAMLRPTIVHAHNQTSLHYAVLGKSVTGARILMTNHGQGTGSTRVPSTHEWNATDAIVTVSHAVAERMDLPHLKHKITTIYNGVCVSPSSRTCFQVRQELGIPPDRVVGTLVARIDGLKGHDTLLHALARLKKRASPVTFLIAGDGAERASTEQLSSELGLTDDTVRFLGFRKDIPDLLEASDLFTLPSLTEGLPLSVLEAMSHSLPIVATRVGGIPELVTHGIDGLLVQTNDASALSDAIADLVNDREKRLAFGEAGCRRAMADFSFDKMNGEYIKLYRSLISAVARTNI